MQSYPIQQEGPKNNKKGRSFLVEEAAVWTMVLHFQPLLDAFLMKVMPAGQFDDLHLSVQLSLLNQSLHAYGANSQLISHLIIDSGRLADPVYIAIEQCLIHTPILLGQSSIMIQTLRILIVLLTDQYAEDRDEEDCRRVQHPYDHRVLHIERTGTHQMREETDWEKSERTLVVLPLKS